MSAIVPHPFTNEFQTIRLYRLDEEVFDVLPLTGVNVVSLAINLPGPAHVPGSPNSEPLRPRLISP
ncbi:hypothetical protein A3N97_08525 [Mycobacteroides abscessus]|nr:hypothetical protein A3N97_08525 [Mycobacteroides abscessus]